MESQDIISKMDAFPDIFNVPKEYGDHWTEVYNGIVSKMRQEAAGLPMTTAQTVLIERIAYTYVSLRFREHDGSLSATAEKDGNSRFLSMVQEFNRMLTNNDDKLREKMLLEVQSIVVEVVSLIKDDKERQSLRQLVAQRFAEADL